jgi:hypothetical protein
MTQHNTRDAGPERDDDSSYPLPAHAISIWKVGHELVLGLPPTAPGVRGTTVRLPLERCEAIASAFGGTLANQRGWAILLDILRQREHAGQRPATVGTRQAPVQYDVDAMIRAMGAAAPKVTRLSPTSLADLGLED